MNSPWFRNASTRAIAMRSSSEVKGIGSIRGRNCGVVATPIKSDERAFRLKLEMETITEIGETQGSEGVSLDSLHFQTVD